VRAPREARVVFWEGVRSGLGWQDAAVAAGFPRGGQVWFREAGGVKGNGAGPVSGRYLSLAEREEIAVGRAAGDGVRVIAARLGRAPSTVSRELRRNCLSRGRYRAVAAQRRAEDRARRPKAAKLAGDDELRGWVQGKLLLVPLPAGRDAPAVAQALTPVIAALPDALRRSLTWDQGWEMRFHQRIAVAADCEIYFCDPHSPWQRGSNENTNGLLRQYFPKGTSLAGHSPAHLAAVADELNGRPRKTLGWKTPAEALAEILDRAAAA
jgi:IS30 family transposase